MRFLLLIATLVGCGAGFEPAPQLPTGPLQGRLIIEQDAEPSGFELISANYTLDGVPIYAFDKATSARPGHQAFDREIAYGAHEFKVQMVLRARNSRGQPLANNSIRLQALQRVDVGADVMRVCVRVARVGGDDKRPLQVSTDDCRTLGELL